MTLELFPAEGLWRHVPIEYPPARELADRHYPRQTPGAKGFMAGGRRFLLWHQGPKGAAAWGVLLNLDPVGALRWRNVLFRNESGTQSSDLIIAATRETYALWRRRYRELPNLPLTTEVEIEATRRRRSKRHPPGWCYLCAGWTKVRDIPAGHGRPAKVELAAPPP